LVHAPRKFPASPLLIPLVVLYEEDLGSLVGHRCISLRLIPTLFSSRFLSLSFLTVSGPSVKHTSQCRLVFYIYNFVSFRLCGLRLSHVEFSGPISNLPSPFLPSDAVGVDHLPFEGFFSSRLGYLSSDFFLPPYVE